MCTICGCRRYNLGALKKLEAGNCANAKIASIFFIGNISFYQVF